MEFTIIIEQDCKLAWVKNCKAITPSDVVVSTRKCNGVTILFWPN